MKKPREQAIRFLPCAAAPFASLLIANALAVPPCGTTLMTTSDRLATDGAGAAVAIQDDRILMGAPQDDHLAGADAGTVYAYRRVNGEWPTEQTTILRPDDLEPGDNFGNSIDMSGQWALIGAQFADPHGLSSGAAYFFKDPLSLGLWGPDQKLTATGGAPSDRFGYAVAIDENIAVVTAPYRDWDGEQSAGAFYTFRYDAPLAGLPPMWIQGPVQTMPLPHANDHFGLAVDIDKGWDGSLLVVGAPHADAHSLNDSGSVLLYQLWNHGGVPPVLSWDLETFLWPDPSDRQPFARFGSAVAVHAGWQIVLVGAPGQDVNGVQDAGAVFVFMWSDWYEEYVQDSILVASIPTQSAGFGSKLALVGDDNLYVADLDGRIARFSSPGGLTFVPNGQWLAPHGSSSKYAESIAAGLDCIVVGDSGYDFPSAADAGAGFIVGAVLGPYGMYVGADHSEHATAMHPNLHQYEGCTVGMSPDGSSSCDPSGTGNDIWYQYHPNGAAWSGDHTLDTLGSDFDTVITVFNSYPPSPASQIACDDNSGPNGTSLLAVELPVISYLDDYYIRVSGQGNQAGHYVLNFHKVVDQQCPADIAPIPGGDDAVNIADLLAVIANWGPCANPANCPSDILPVGGDNAVGINDLLGVISAWGACP